MKESAGLLMYKYDSGKIKVFLVHPGGPFFNGKDEHSWDIPKGEVKENESFFQAAKREFMEETGVIAPADEKEYFSLGNATRKDGKIIHIWAFKGDWTGLLMCSSFVSLEYPKFSGNIIKFPEIDKAGFFNLETAKNKVYPSLLSFLNKFEQEIKNNLFKP